MVSVLSSNHAECERPGNLMNHRRLYKLFSLLTLTTLLNLSVIGQAFAQTPVVHAVLFYSPTCGHCHYVITEVLPPLFEQYGDQLQLMGVDVTTANGQALYQSAVQRFEIGEDRRGVPNLIVDDHVLVGSIQIPEEFPGLIEEYLDAGGVDWPDIPGLAEAVQANDEARAAATAQAAEAGVDEPLTVEAVDVASSETAASGDLMSKLQRDPVGNGIAIVVLIGMIAVIVQALRRTLITKAGGPALGGGLTGWRSWGVAAFGILGLLVSIYMTYVETTQTTAVCGPIGDCNAVQQSAYAMLFGTLPIGVLGLVGYAAILIAWAGSRWGQASLRSLAEAALFGMALFGTLFSIYLTFLEPFVIGATCAWCLTSAICMTAILLLQLGTPSIQPGPAGQTTQAEATS